MITGKYYISCRTSGNTYDVTERDGGRIVRKFKTYAGASAYVKRAELAELSKPRKRAKQVFSTGEIPHLWAHKVQASARNLHGNLFFDGDVIYSYGKHFPIARHVKQGKRCAILFTVAGYSVTTARHISDVRGAIPSGVPVFNVPSLGTGWGDGVPTHSDNLAHYQTEINRALDSARNARKAGAYHLRNAKQLREEMRSYAQFYSLKCRPVFPSPVELRKLETVIRERVARARVADAERTERERIVRAERERIAALELAEQIELWRAGNPSVQTWQLRNAPAMLRIIGTGADAQVETSRGARVPVSHAARGLRLVRMVMHSGREYRRNGHTVHLGHYAIDSVTADGTLTAGCHVISWAEIARVAPVLETFADAEQTGEQSPTVATV